MGCSICDFDLESEFIVAHRHPTLGVALCGACREACAEASAEACTWCGQSRGIMWKCAGAGKGAGAGDAPCQHMFCDGCAQLALPADRVRDDGSRVLRPCLVCDPTPLAQLQQALLDARARWSMAETAYRAAIAADLEHSSLPVEKQAVLVDRLLRCDDELHDALARLEGCDEVAEASDAAKNGSNVAMVSLDDGTAGQTIPTTGKKCLATLGQARSVRHLTASATSSVLTWTPPNLL